MKQFELTWKAHEGAKENSAHYLLKSCAEDMQRNLQAWGYETRIEEIQKPLVGFDD